MSEELMVRHCSPTLANMKTANMVSVPYETKEDMVKNLREWNRLLRKKGIRAIPLRFKDKKALVYIYRYKSLARDLRHSLANSILREKGYGTGNVGSYIKKLIEEINKSDDFPHEIGLFLGYPPEDVNSFMKNKEEDLKCVGCWKVYNNEEEAKKTFCKYKKCTKVYCNCLLNGRPLEKMILPS